jgi:anti-anti-sigma regulatory factor
MGGEIKLAGVSQKVLDVLSVCRLNTFFEICLGEEAALQAFRQGAR